MTDYVVIVCGGHDYANRENVYKVMDLLLQATLNSGKRLSVFHGGARGADQLAEDWAIARFVNCRAFAADWAGVGRRAGPLRNQQMLEALLEFKPNCGVVAFQGGVGTSDMKSRARAAGLSVVEPRD